MARASRVLHRRQKGVAEEGAKLYIDLGLILAKNPEKLGIVQRRHRVRVLLGHGSG